MAYFLKLIGTGNVPAPEPYTQPYVDFSPFRNPAGIVNVDDYLLLYAAGGRRTFFATAKVTDSNVYAGDQPEWPFRMKIEYITNVSPADGISIFAVNAGRDLSTRVRHSFTSLLPVEYRQASEMLSEVG